MKKIFFVIIIAGTSLLASSCVKSTSSDTYDSHWRPFAQTTWIKSTSVTNFIPADGGCVFDVSVDRTNAVDTLGVKLTLSPEMYIVSNIETGSSALLTVTGAVSSVPDSMKLVTAQINPVTHDTVRYAHFQFATAHWSIQTFGKDSVFTQSRKFESDQPFAYAPSIHPDSCSVRMYIRAVVNWNTYTGPAVTDTLKATAVSLTLKNMSLSVSGIDILK